MIKEESVSYLGPNPYYKIDKRSWSKSPIKGHEPRKYQLQDHCNQFRMLNASMPIPNTVLLMLLLSLHNLH